MMYACAIVMVTVLAVMPAHAEDEILNGTDDGIHVDTIEQSLTLKVYATMEGAMVVSNCEECTFNDLQTEVLREHTTVGASSSVHLFAIGVYAHVLFPLTHSIDLGLMTGLILPFAGSWQPIPLRIPIKGLVKINIADALAITPEIGAILVADRVVEGFVLSVDLALAINILQAIDVRVGLIYGNHFGIYGGIGVSLVNFAHNLELAHD